MGQVNRTTLVALALREAVVCGVLTAPAFKEQGLTGVDFMGVGRNAYGGEGNHQYPTSRRIEASTSRGLRGGGGDFHNTGRVRRLLCGQL